MTSEHPANPSPFYRDLALAGGAGLLSGLLIFNSDYPLHLWPMMTVAFLPFLVILLRPGLGHAHAALTGLGLTLGYLIPLVFVLRFPFLISVFFIAYYAAFWVGFSLLVPVLWRRPGLGAVLATGALAALVDWGIYSAVPVWGTAQSLGKALIDCPWGVGFVAFTGLAGVVGVLVTLQTLLVAALRYPSLRLKAALAALIMLVLLVTVNCWISRPEPVGTVRVGALTFMEPKTPEGEPRPALENIETHIRPMVAEAVRQGARIVATPELALRAGAEDRDAARAALSGIAREHGIWLFAGFFDKVDDKNRLLFITPQGEIEAVYEKVHLIYDLEFYNPGDGTLRRVQAAGATWGGVICQDDNFPDMVSAYARAGVQAMVVPTFDWSEVKDFHFESSRFRSVEYRHAILRSAMEGISAIIAPGGRVVAKRDVFTDGDGVLVGDLPLPALEDVRARCQGWFPILCGLLAFVFFVRSRRK